MRLKRVILALCIGLGVSLTVMAVPARPMARTLTLEDGTVVNAVARGDEHFHYWEANGVAYVRTQGGFYAPASTEMMAQRRAEMTEAETEGTTLNMAPRGLVILANFSNVSFRSENSRAEMDSMLNGQSYHYYKSIGSAASYFRDQSMGQYTPQFDVVGPVTLPLPVSYYGQNRNNDANSEDCRAADMVLRACSIASGLAGVDMSRYDNNGDGTLDFVYVIYAGYGEADSQIDSLVWPASWTMGSAVRGGYTSLPRNASRAQYTFGGKTIGSYAYSPELNYYNSYNTPEQGHDSICPFRAGIGTFCHEFSHVLGLPDYYDTQYGQNWKRYMTPGSWHLMDTGNYNADGYVPPSYSVFDRWFCGWDTPQLLCDSGEVTLPADNHTAYYMTRNNQVATYALTDTVYYLENRQQSGWDTGLPGHGMLVWQVVYDTQEWANMRPNDVAGQPRCIIVAADGVRTEGDDGDTYPGTAGVTTCTLFGRQLSNIREVGTDVLLNYETALPIPTKLENSKIGETEVEAVYDINGRFVGTDGYNLPAGIYLLRYSDGKVEKRNR